VEECGQARHLPSYSLDFCGGGGGIEITFGKEEDIPNTNINNKEPSKNSIKSLNVNLLKKNSNYTSSRRKINSTS
jgi:hypothetical protein